MRTRIFIPVDENDKPIGVVAYREEKNAEIKLRSYREFRKLPEDAPCKCRVLDFFMEDEDEVSVEA
jgi:hypothetical protein